MYFYFSKWLAPILNPINFLIIFIILFYLLNLILKKNKLNILINIFVINFLFISIFPIGELGLNYFEKKFYIQKKINHIDNIIVLAGAENLNSTILTKKTTLNDSAERLIATVKLSLDYPDANIIYLGGDGLLIKSRFNEIDVAKSFFIDLKFDLNKIKFLGKSRNTIENIESLERLKISSNKKNVLITSAYHMKRSLMIAEYLGLSLIPYATDFRAVPSQILLNKYQRFSISDNLKKFNLLFREIIGIFAFKLFY